MAVRALALAVLLLAAPPLSASPEGGGPFPPGGRPAPFPLIGLANPLRPASGPAGPLVVDLPSDAGPRQLTARVAGGPPAELGGAFVAGVEAWSADLNGDGRPDYVVRTASGGCGLAASYTYFTFFLSSPAGPRPVSLTTMDGAPADFVDVDGDGRPEFVHAAFVHGEAGRDGRAHNYWVYHLLRFEGTGLVPAREATGRFPCWIMHARRPNHTPTRQLTPAQKRRLWSASCAEQAWFPGADRADEPCSGDARAR